MGRRLFCCIRTFWHASHCTTENDCDVGTYRLGASDVYSTCRYFQIRTGRYSATVVNLLHPFFVDASAGGLTQRTHLSVRPYIMHRGNHPRRGKHHASRKTHQRGDWGGGYSDTFFLCGRIRRWVKPTDAPAGTSLHHASRKTSPGRESPQPFTKCRKTKEK